VDLARAVMGRLPSLAGSRDKALVAASRKLVKRLEAGD